MDASQTLATVSAKVEVNDRLRACQISVVPFIGGPNKKRCGGREDTPERHIYANLLATETSAVAVNQR